MPTTRSLAWLFAAALAFPGARAAGQSNDDLAAFSALIVSPVGALPPVASDHGGPLPERASVAISYGRWRFDIDDAIHHNLGVTLAHRVGSSNTSVALTAAYLSSSCDCSGWESGGVSLSSVLWSTATPGRSNERLTGHTSAELMVGGARFMGDGHASAYSFAAVFDLGGSLRTGRSSRLALSLLPGVGIGHISSVDQTGGGVRPVLGAAAAWRLARGISFDVGVRRIVLIRGPTQFGANISWRAL